MREFFVPEPAGLQAEQRLHSRKSQVDAYDRRIKDYQQRAAEYNEEGKTKMVQWALSEVRVTEEYAAPLREEIAELEKIVAAADLETERLQYRRDAYLIEKKNFEEAQEDYRIFFVRKVEAALSTSREAAERVVAMMADDEFKVSAQARILSKPNAEWERLMTTKNSSERYYEERHGQPSVRVDA